MAGSTESEAEYTSQHVTNPAEIIKQARHAKCHARLFDARVSWSEVSVRDAWLIIKCWRCKRYVGFKPDL